MQETRTVYRVTPESGERESGFVVNWNPGSHFGFIQRQTDPNRRSAFVHASELPAGTLYPLPVGTRVTFVLTNRPKGPRASAVELASASSRPLKKPA
jgi:cold shock CspA family protein